MIEVDEEREREKGSEKERETREMRGKISWRNERPWPTTNDAPNPASGLASARAGPAGTPLCV